MAGLRKKSIVLLLVLISSAAFLSCAGPQLKDVSTKGIYHKVKKGETAYSIARAYSISLKTLAETNAIDDPAILKEGTVLFIPGATSVIDDVMAHAKGMDVKPSHETVLPQKKEVAPQEEKREADSSLQKPVQAAIVEETGKKDQPKMFIWPVEGAVKTRFGRQPNKAFHNWIKIAVKDGAPVKAAADGMVIFSSQLKDYGQTVIIRHKNDFTTVYTRLQKRHVKADQGVKQGDSIASAGEKDATGATYINFEIRIKGKASDPVLYLP